ncbi:autoinducer binding domain-containing protein [Pseudomonas synxantha]|uniref:Autoinducer binding domain-containing protein n=2 Tax=Pseudomonas synxantha TaxID=47883 RepID=A0ABS0URI0_9PSED|nr:autoinducer binding domain-containing protein [Pseudomonas synxantha]MBI6584511.1 autoinducer binding domain-containing protein [Pseudomonas synxantha]MBI6647204.1 autoinducer binding domain-containing protein [Pseudomonas synxantha]
MTEATAERAMRAVFAIEAAQTLEAIQQAVRGFAEVYGYDRFVLFSASSASEEVVERIYWVEGDWFGSGQDVDAQTYVRRCPITRHVLDNREAFFWIKVQDQGGERYHVVRAPSGPGVQGLQVPVFGPQGLEGAMSLGGERVDGSARVRLGLSMVATAAFFCARRLLEPPVAEWVGKLSLREREVLAWTAAGRRQADIAATLGLSERTVENHLRSARRRLGVATTAQAVRIAIRKGEIEG